MTKDYFFEICRKQAINCLNRARLVTDDVAVAQNCLAYIIDMLLGTAYTVLSIVMLWIGDINLWVFSLNLLCLGQTRIKTHIKNCIYTTSLITRVGYSSSGKERNLFLKSNSGYAFQTKLEDFVLIMNVVSLVMVLLPGNVILPMYSGIVISISMVALCFDNAFSCLTDMYSAHPPRP